MVKILCLVAAGCLAWAIAQAIPWPLALFIGGLIVGTAYLDSTMEARP